MMNEQPGFSTKSEYERFCMRGAKILPCLCDDGFHSLLTPDPVPVAYLVEMLESAKIPPKVDYHSVPGFDFYSIFSDWEYGQGAIVFGFIPHSKTLFLSEGFFGKSIKDGWMHGFSWEEWNEFVECIEATQHAIPAHIIFDPKVDIFGYPQDILCKDVSGYFTDAARDANA